MRIRDRVYIRSTDRSKLTQQRYDFKADIMHFNNIMSVSNCSLPYQPRHTMLTELPGLVLSRTIPDDCLAGVVTGAYQICGGVVRNTSGQIVAQLINSGASIASATPLSAAAEAVNMAQLYRIGKSVASIEAATSQLVSLA